MDQIKKLSQILIDFQTKASSKTDLYIHKDNLFNKQVSLLMREGLYISIIANRIKDANTETEITQMNLDLKTLYVFGRVFAESVLYISSLFLKDTKGIEWTKLGPFLGSVEKNLEMQNDSFKAFWSFCGDEVKSLHEVFKYRHDVLHDKISNTEWTMFWPGHGNLDSVSIANVAWRESGKNKETKTLTPTLLIRVLAENSTKVISYLERTFLNG